MNILKLPTIKLNRVNGKKYMYKGCVRIWDGKRLRCEHGRQCNLCKDCHGSGICVHDKFKATCRECDGSSFCEHDRRKSTCKDCDGSGICVHDRLKAQCRECGGSSFCEHDKRRYDCPDCCPSDQRFKRFCRICGIKKTNRPSRICLSCDETTIERIEYTVKNYILPKLQPPSSNDSQLSGKICDEATRRADILWIGQDRVIQVEIDEHEHKDREVLCELSKMDSSKWGLHVDDQCKPMFFARFNPDGCLTDEEFHDRCNHLVNTIQSCFERKVTPDNLKPQVIYMYYSENNKHLLAAREKEHFTVIII
tara:strand:- start:33 stop:959 length:927 start_codon:yes stop_codon:yes gene_type:complete